jgi:hypothetical protein
LLCKRSSQDDQTRRDGSSYEFVEEIGKSGLIEGEEDALFAD